MIGFGANRRGGRLPSFILIFLMLIIAILSFNYWTVSNKHGRLLDELAEIQTQIQRSDAARSRLEKRNSELIVQVDTHRKQIDQKDGDYSVLEGKLQAREVLIKKCSDEKTDKERGKKTTKQKIFPGLKRLVQWKIIDATDPRPGTYSSQFDPPQPLFLEMKVQSDVANQITEILRLKEQLKELKQEFMKQEEQLREVKKNSTTLEKKLEYESLQCGRQIAQLKQDYEDIKKALEEEASKQQLAGINSQKGVGAERHVGGALAVDAVRERHTVVTHGHDRLPELKGAVEEMGKPGSDAGMPGIEDSEVGKMDEVQFALKKPAITQKHGEGPDAVAAAGAEPGLGAADGPGGQGLSLDQPRLQQDRLEARAAAPHGINKQADKPVVFEDHNKAAIKADELGEQQRQIQVPDIKSDRERLKRIPLPQDNAQVPKPIQPQRAKDQVPAEQLHHRQSRFFDENESPVDPQHGSKLADYNGDDGNVGEYEADKQAELAYNEEEDGDGGEEDVQDDDDHDIQENRAVDYGKRHQANDIL